MLVRVHATMEAAEQDWATPGLAGYAFQTLAWLRAWQDTMGAAAGIRPALAVVTDAGGRVLLCLPLGVATRRGIRTLAFLGGNVTDYNAPLADPAFTPDAASFAALWRQILQALPPHDVIRLVRMPATLDPPGGAGQSPVPNPMALLAGAHRAGEARSARLPASYDTFMAGRRPKFVADTRRLHRRMAEIGPVTLRVAATAEDMQSTLGVLFQLKSRRWRETGSKDWADDPPFRAFYHALSRSGLPGGEVHGSLLTIGDTPVAVHWGVIYRARFYYLMIGWAAGEWMRFATGRQITDALIRQAIPAGIRVFDFTAGDEPYKRDWVDTTLPLLAYTAATTRRGQAALALHHAARQLRTRAKGITWLRKAVRRARGLPPMGD